MVKEKYLYITIAALIILGYWAWFSIGTPPNPQGKLTYAVMVESNTNWSGVVGSRTQSLTVQGNGNQTIVLEGNAAIIVSLRKNTDQGFLSVAIVRGQYEQEQFLQGTLEVLDKEATTQPKGIVNMVYQG